MPLNNDNISIDSNFYNIKGGIHMDIAALSMSLSNMKVAQEISTSVLKLAMDSSVEKIADLTKIMEQSVNPYIGANIDIKG